MTKYVPAKRSAIDTPGAVLKKELRDAVLEKHGRRCARCDFRDARALQIDHVHNDGAQERRNGTTSVIVYLQRVLGDTDGRYQILCANCNTIKEHERRNGVVWSRRGLCRCGTKIRHGRSKKESDLCSKCHRMAQADLVLDAMRERGISAAQAAQEFGVDRSTAQLVARRAGVQRRRGREHGLLVSFGAFLFQHGAPLKEAAEAAGASTAAIAARFSPPRPRTSKNAP